MAAADTTYSPSSVPARSLYAHRCFYNAFASMLDYADSDQCPDVFRHMFDLIHKKPAERSHFVMTDFQSSPCMAAYGSVFESIKYPSRKRAVEIDIHINVTELDRLKLISVNTAKDAERILRCVCVHHGDPLLLLSDFIGFDQFKTVSTLDGVLDLFDWINIFHECTFAILAHEKAEALFPLLRLVVDVKTRRADPGHFIILKRALNFVRVELTGVGSFHSSHLQRSHNNYMTFKFHHTLGDLVHAVEAESDENVDVHLCNGGDVVTLRPSAIRALERLLQKKEEDGAAKKKEMILGFYVQEHIIDGYSLECLYDLCNNSRYAPALAGGITFGGILGAISSINTSKPKLSSTGLSPLQRWLLGRGDDGKARTSMLVALFLSALLVLAGICVWQR